MPHHDLVIIGSGSGNSLLTPQLDGLDVAIVEGGTFGGTCLNVGCIPTKMFVLPADRVVEADDAHRLGVTFAAPTVDWPGIRDRIFGRIDPISAGGEAYRLGQEHTTLYRAHATFTGARRLALSTGEEVTADRLVVAAGSHPVGLDVDGLRVPDPDRGLHTSDTVMRLDALPPRMAVIGGGFVACEMAHVFAALGVAVTQVQRGPALLRHHEVEVSQRYTEAARHRYDLRLSTTPTSAERVGDVWRIGLTGPGGPSHVEAEVVLLAVGRVPNTDRLDPAAGGLEVHDDGRLVVDEQLRATAPGVWALGDVSSPHQLKHVANHEARIVAHNLAVDLGRLRRVTAHDRRPPGAARRVRAPAGRGVRPDRGRARRGRNALRHRDPVRRRRGLRLGPGGHDRPADGARRPHRADPRGPRHRAARVDRHPAARAGRVVRAARARRRARAVLDPPGPGRGRRERPARAAAAAPRLTGTPVTPRLGLAASARRRGRGCGR